MKHNVKNVMSKFAWLFIAAMVAFTACKKDDEPLPKIDAEDGVYVVGAGTALTDFDPKGLMKATNNEVGQAPRAGLMELYIAVKAGTDGFNIVEVTGGKAKTFGPGTDFAVVLEADKIGDEPREWFSRGSLAETTTKFTVPEDGLYHVVYDKTLNVVIVARVKWGIIGAASPGGWGTSTQFEDKGFNLNTMTFELAAMPMTVGDFKFRYSNGWKIVIDGEVVRVNTNYGGSVASLEPGGANIANSTSGLYTAKMVWTLGGVNTATLTRTGDLPIVDYTDTELGLIGNGIIYEGEPNQWVVTLYLHKPVVENETNFTWTWDNVELTTEGSFKIREGQSWDNLSFGYPQVTMAGLAAGDFETNNDGNFVPKVNGNFDIEFKIDAVAETFTFTVNPAGVAPELYVLGDGCDAGWINTAALPLSGTGGNYTITTNLKGDGKFIKFITTLGQWAPMYGTDGTGTSSGGPLVYRATESDPDPASIPVPAAVGDYVITVNTNTMTYTIAPAK